jgi:hypothetical protein
MPVTSHVLPGRFLPVEACDPESSPALAEPCRTLPGCVRSHETIDPIVVGLVVVELALTARTA